jgi:hypothetical protein
MTEADDDSQAHRQGSLHKRSRGETISASLAPTFNESASAEDACEEIREALSKKSFILLSFHR